MKKRIIVFDGFWDRNTVRTNPRALFVFGDNDLGIGQGGQAVIRGLPNAIGLSTKKIPDSTPASFYTDKEYDENCIKIQSGLCKVMKEFLKDKYLELVIPRNGLGTGLSDLPKKAPKTYRYLKKSLESMMEFIQQGSSKHMKH